MYSNMPLITSAYELRTSYVTVGGLPPQQILPADPRRWAIRFTIAPSSTAGLQVMAHNMKIDPLANAGIGFAITNTQLVKFNDDPALVGQQWYGVVLMGNAILLRIDEQIFIGG